MAQTYGAAMPRSLKLYIAGVVSAERACARCSRLLCLPADRSDRARFGIDGSRHRPSRPTDSCVCGLAFWTVLTLVASALAGPAAARHPVRPSRSHRSSQRWPWAARPSAGWVAADRNDRDPRAAWARSLGTGRWRTTPESCFRPSLAALSCEVVRRRADRCLRRIDFVATMVGAAVFFVPERRCLRPCVVALRTGQSVRGRRSSATRAASASTCLALAPLGWLMAQSSTRMRVVGDRCCSRCRCTRRGWRTSGSSRCARCSRRRSGRWPRRWTSAIRSRASTASG